MTEIKDHLTYANGQPVNGQVIVSWQAFLIGGGISIAGGSVTSFIIDGDLDLELESNAGTQPRDNYYTATYELESGPVYDETWIVPSVGQANLAQVRVNFPVQPSAAINPLQLTSMGASAGQFLQWNGTSWIPQYISISAVDPNYIQMAIGVTGTDVNVVGSPVSLGNVVTINVPDAGGLSRGVINTGGQNIAGQKTFLDNMTIDTLINLADHPEYLDYQFYRAIYCSNDYFVTANIGVLSGKNLTNPVPQAGFPRDPEITWNQTQYLFRRDSPIWNGVGWAGLGCDGNGNVWMRTGYSEVGQFFYLQPDGSTQTVQGRFDVFQHPTVPGAFVTQTDASLVLYSVNSAGDWVGFGVDTSPALWIHARSGASGSADYVFGFQGATFPFLTVTGTLMIAGQPAMVDPTTTHGDLIVHAFSGTTRFPCGVDGQALVTDSTTAPGLRWANMAVNPTTTKGDLIVNNGGALVRQPVGLIDQVLGADPNTATGLSWVNTMTDPTMQVGDLITRNSFGLTNLPVGPDGTFLQANSAEPTGLVWAAGGGGGGANQTPWLSDIDASFFKLSDVGAIGVGVSAAANPLVMVNVVSTGSNQIGFRHVDSNTSGTPGLQAQNDLGHSGYVEMVGSAWSTQFHDMLLIRTDFSTDIGFGASGTTSGEAMRIKGATGRVGIGTSTPAYLLDVVGAVNATSLLINGVPVGTGGQSPWTSNIDAAAFNLNNAGAIGVGTAAGAHALTVQSAAAVSFDIYSQNTNPGSTPGMALINDSNDQVQFGLGGSTAGGGPLRRIAFWITTRDIAFGTGSSFTERMRITAAGNVGIGTATPDVRLTVSDNVAALPASPAGTVAHFGTTDGNSTRLVFDSFGVGSNITMRTAYGTAASPTAVIAGAILGAITFWGRGATGYSGARASMAGYASEAWTDAAQGAYIAFVTTTSGTLTTTERMRIDASGNVGIGTASPAMPLSVVGSVNGTYNGVVVANLNATTAGNSAAITFALGNSGSTPTGNIANVFESSGNGALAFSTFSSAMVERMRITAAGLVGIGTSGPIYKLSIAADGSAFGITGTGNPSIYMALNNGGGGTLIGLESNAGGSLVVGGLPYAAVFNVQGAHALQLGTGNAARLTVDPSVTLG
jgi:hypothetical protein